MCIEHRELVQKLALAGIEFSAPLRAPGGATTVILSARQALAYLEDRNHLAASYFGLSDDEYEMWVALDGQAMCGALTLSGAQCRNPLNGRTQLSAMQWKQRHGGLCAVHGGEGSDT